MQQQLVSILVLTTGQMTNVCCEAFCVVWSVDPTVDQHLLYGEFLFLWALRPQINCFWPTF